MVYLYPGLSLGLVGQYSGCHLRAAREAVLVGLSLDREGLPSLAMETVRGSRLLTYEQPGSITPAKNCTVGGTPDS